MSYRYEFFDVAMFMDADDESSEASCTDFDVSWSDIALFMMNRYIKTIFEKMRTKRLLFFVLPVFMYQESIHISINKYRRMRGIVRMCHSSLLKILDTVVKRLSAVLFPCDSANLFSDY